MVKVKKDPNTCVSDHVRNIGICEDFLSEDYPPEHERKLKQYGDWTRINNQTVIYQDNKTKRRNYIVRLLLDNGSYKLRTTKTTDKRKAEKFAIEFYEDMYLRQRHHLPLHDKTVQDVLDYWVKNDGGQLTERRRNVVVRWFENVFVYFLTQRIGHKKGLDTDVQRITPSELKQFAFWRIDDATIQFLEEQNRYSRKMYARRKPSKNSLGGEIGNFNVVTRCAHRNNLIDHPVLIPTLAKTNIKLEGRIEASVRPSVNTFTPEQIQCLRKYFPTYIRPSSTWCRGICKLDEDNNPVRKEDGSIRSKNGMYVSRINLYCSFFILLNTGIRLSELYSLQWKNIERINAGNDSKGRAQYVWLLRVGETKPYRIRKAMVPPERIVVGPKRLGKLFELIKRENPKFCTDEDYIINIKGRRRRTQQELFRALQASQSDKLDCRHHESGSTLDLRHLRSYYVSKKLLVDSVSPILIQRQTGHSLDTILKFYLTHRPQKKQLLQFGGWKVEQELIEFQRAAKADLF